jgi:cystathionine beta-lyase
VQFAAAVPPERVHAFVDALRLFRIGYSWAGPVSLAVPYDLATIRPGSGRHGTLVRFSIGLEDVHDLRADLEQALCTAFGGSGAAG